MTPSKKKTQAFLKIQIHLDKMQIQNMNFNNPVGVHQTSILCSQHLHQQASLQTITYACIFQNVNTVFKFFQAMSNLTMTYISFFHSNLQCPWPKAFKISPPFFRHSIYSQITFFTISQTNIALFTSKGSSQVSHMPSSSETHKDNTVRTVCTYMTKRC